MKAGLKRRLADRLCRALSATLPAASRGWGDAVRCEAMAIQDDGQALSFVLESVAGLIPRALATRAAQGLAWLAGEALDPTSLAGLRGACWDRPRAVGVLCAIGAVMAGLGYLAVAGAPMRYLAVNLAALLGGLAISALLGRIRAGGHLGELAIAALACPLLATALWGQQADGAARWISLGGLAAQPALVCLPAMLVGFSRTRGVMPMIGVIVAAIAVAMQPDRAMAGLLVLGLGVLALFGSDRRVMLALMASIAGFGVTLARADSLSPAPFVDRVLSVSFDLHLAAGVAVMGGAALLLIPAAAGWTRDPGRRAAYAVFGGVWFAVLFAAALGRYPTPLVGYGGSAIVGYVISLITLPRTQARQGAPDAADSVDETQTSGRLLLLGA